MRTIEQRMEDIDRLRKNYLVLKNQREVLETLSLAMQIGFGAMPDYDKADALLKIVAGEVVKTVDQIVTLSELEPTPF